MAGSANATDNEQIVLLSDAGEPIGAAPKLASHHANTPLHLAFSVYVFNGQGKLLLTKRALTKKVFPGVWTNSCCGHPMPNESMEVAIKRRLNFELGLKPLSITLVLPNFRYRAKMNGIVENEICPVYIARVSGEPTANHDEVDDYSWVSWQTFMSKIKHSRKQFSPWSIKQAKLLNPYVSTLSFGNKDTLHAITRYRKPLALDINRHYANSRKRGKNQSNRWHDDALARLEQYTSGGKILRGCLLCYSHEAFGGTNPKAAKLAASCLELLHAALLIHDDVIDRDTTRRGRPAMHQQYQSVAVDKTEAAHFGESMAICVADTAIFMALQLLGSLDAPKKQKSQLLQLFGNVLSTVCYGQMLDIELGHTRKLPRKQDILTVMEQKTAVYSMALPLMAGAILAGQPQPVINKLGRLGNFVGTIFQIRDDELGVFGDPAKTGKSAASDIKEGKKTLLYYYLLSSSPVNQRRKFKALFGNPSINEASINNVRRAMIKLNVLSKIEADIAVLDKQARLTIDQLSIDGVHKRNLLELVDFCAKREI